MDVSESVVYNGLIISRDQNLNFKFNLTVILLIGKTLYKICQLVFKLCVLVAINKYLDIGNDLPYQFNLVIIFCNKYMYIFKFRKC